MLLNYLTEIVSKKDWKEKYAKKVWSRIDINIYKKSIRHLKAKIFKKSNVTDNRYIFINVADNGKITQNNIFVYVLDENDKQMIDIINQLPPYKIPKGKERSFLSIAKVLRGSRLESVNNVYNSNELSKWMQNLPEDNASIENEIRSRTEKLEQLKQDPEKNAKAIQGIEKRLEKDRSGWTKKKVRDIFIKYFNKYSEIYKNKNIIVLTYDTRAVASQSTGNSWRSCMNLDSGEYKQFVPSTITGGSFIAYLTTKKDKYELKDPISRILCKSYYANDVDGKNPDVIWVASRSYGKSYEWFREAISNFLNDNNKPKYRRYRRAPYHYDDGDQAYVEFKGDDLINNLAAVTKFDKITKKSSLGDLTDDEYADLAREVLGDDEFIRDALYEYAESGVYDHLTDYTIDQLEDIKKDKQKIEFLFNLLDIGEKDRVVNFQNLVRAIVNLDVSDTQILNVLRFLKNNKNFDNKTERLEFDPRSPDAALVELKQKLNRIRIYSSMNQTIDFLKYALEHMDIVNDLIDFFSGFDFDIQETRDRYISDVIDDIERNLIKRNIHSVPEDIYDRFIDLMEDTFNNNY